ncbi:MAG TPA: PLP-dependent aminotransferase family protein [Steroidobacteraceae bacterium]|jgi:GntR family transcriptional regulator/MocR family aminotransferase
MPKKAASLYSVDVVNPAFADQPAHMRIAERIRMAITSGALKADARLPSGRTLARDFGVARNTVDEALSQLVAEGIVVRRRGAGSFVSALTSEPAARPSAANSARAPRISMRAQILRNYPGHTASNPAVAFAPSLPPSEFFPRRVWRKLLVREAAHVGNENWESGPSSGLGTLREAIASHASALRGTRAAADQVIVTTSTQQAVELAAKVLADPGESAWAEAPGYQPVIYVMRSAGLEVVPVPIDSEGLDVAAGRRLNGRARFAYVTPSHQYPLGVEMSLTRRRELLEWADEEDAFVVEDDYDGDYRYEGKPITSLQDLNAGRVIYIGSFNKLLFPGLRVAYAIVPPGLAAPFANAKHAADGHTALLAQAVLAAFIREGHLAEHLRRTRKAYDERRRAFLKHAVLLEEFLDFGPASAGLHVTGFFKNASIIDRRVAQHCAALGVRVEPLSRHGTDRQGLVFGFTTASAEAAPRALGVVHRAIREALAG